MSLFEMIFGKVQKYTVYESITTLYRITKETRGNGDVWYNLEHREKNLFRKWFFLSKWHSPISYKNFNECKAQIELRIKDDDNSFNRRKIVSKEIL